MKKISNRTVYMNITKVFIVAIVCMTMSLTQAESLLIDYGGSSSPVQSGYQAYTAGHEQPATFTIQSYSVFGTTVSIAPSWASGAEAAAMQMMDRGAQSYEDATEDLMRDWIGTDTRSAGDPLTLTISGLPAGTYTWGSYHHDTDASNMGLFDVTVNDANGQATTSGIQITGNAVTTFDNVAAFTTTIVSDGSDVTLVFDQQPYSNKYNEAWFLMNGFELQGDTCHVDINSTFQTIEGLGGAICFYNNWFTAHPYNQEIFDYAFSGLQISMLRLGNWWRGTDGQDTATYDIVSAANQRLNYSVPILMTSWSPPAYLKSNGEVGNGGTLIQIEGEYDYAGFADYWYDSLQDYSTHGIVPTWIGIQNEPDWTASYDSCRFNPSEDQWGGNYYASFALAQDAVYQRLQSMATPPKLLGPECIGLYNDADALQDYMAEMNPNTFYGIAHHLYGGSSDETPDGYNAAFNTVLNASNTLFPGKPRFMTEYGDFNDMIDTANLIHNSLVVERVSGYNHWSLIWPGQIGLVEIENPWDSNNWTSPKGYWLNPSYWSMKHYSYFIRPGYRRVAATSSNSDVLASAYLSPGDLQLVIVFINRSTDTPATVTLDTGSFTYSNSSVYRTAGTNYFESLGPITSSQLTLPVESITTICLSDDSSPPTPNPAIFTIAPTAISHSKITMTATTGSDASGPVEYYFTCTGGGGHDSGWQTSETYTDSGLSSNTQYTYTVTMRDSAPTPNVGGTSSPASDITFISAAQYQEIGGILSIEAENGMVGSRWITGADAGASGGAYIEIDPAYDNPTGAPACTTTECIAAYDFNISTSDDYKFWFRMYSNNAAADSFFWRIDDGSWILENGQYGVGSWFSTDNTQVNNLSTGSHVLEIAYRENGTRLDKFVIQLDSLSDPSGDGPAESNQNYGDLLTNCRQVQVLGYRLDEDLNGDCEIEMADLILLTDQWLSTSPAAVPPNYSPDLVIDNEINLADFAAMADQWLVCNDPETAGCIMNW